MDELKSGAGPGAVCQYGRNLLCKADPADWGRLLEEELGRHDPGPEDALAEIKPPPSPGDFGRSLGVPKALRGAMI